MEHRSQQPCFTPALPHTPTFLSVPQFPHLWTALTHLPHRSAWSGAGPAPPRSLEVTVTIITESQAPRVGVQGSGLCRACPHLPAGLGVLPPGEGGWSWSAPANPSLPAWQPEDNASQKYLCGWRKVNFSASLFFPGNCGHCQIQQNRSRDRGEVPAGSRRALPPPLAHSLCLLPSGSVAVGVGDSRA